MGKVILEYGICHKKIAFICQGANIWWSQVQNHLNETEPEENQEMECTVYILRLIFYQ